MLSATELRRRLKEYAKRQKWEIREEAGKGSHLKIMLNGRRTVIPCHGGKDIKMGTLRKILKDLEITLSDIGIGSS